MEVVKEKRWLFEQSTEVKKKIIVTEMKCRSSNIKKLWVLSEDIKNCYEVQKLGKKKDGYLNEVWNLTKNNSI